MKTIRDLTFLYQNPHDPQMLVDRETAKQDIETFVQKRKGNDTYLSDAAVLKEALDEYCVLMEQYPYGLKEAVYFELQTTITDDDVLRSKKTQADTLSRELFVQIQFFQLSLSKIVEEYQRVFLHSPLLTAYAYFLEKLFKNARYTLSEAEEKVITMLSAPAYQNRVDMSKLFLSREWGYVTVKDQDYTLEELGTLTNNPDQAVRDGAAQQINIILLRKIDVCEQEMNAIIEYNYILSSLRGYPRVDQSALIRDDLDAETVDVLVATVTNAYSMAHEVYQIRATLLGKETLKYHERNVTDFGTTIQKKYSFEEGVSLVRSVFNELGSSYGVLLDELLSTGMIDVYSKKGKRGGAFNYGLGKGGGNMILLNRTNELNDVSTLAHEMGHAINIDAVTKQQHGLNFGYGGYFLAEVASTFFEGFVIKKVLAEATVEEKKMILIKKLTNEVNTIFRQIACYTFERDLHETRKEKGYMGKDQIGNIFKTHMAAYMGQPVDLSSGAENRRVQWHHIRTFFYTYSYAGGLLLAKALQRMVKENPSAMNDIQKYYLSVGDGASAKTIFANLGIDITKPAIWEQGLQEFADDLAELKALL